MSGERRNKAIAPYALPAGLRPAQSLVGARKLAVEGDEFAAERLREPEVARIVDGERGLLGQDEGLREIDLLELDRQRIEQGECLQQRLAFLRSRPDFLETRACHLEREQARRMQRNIAQARKNLVTRVFVEQQRDDRGGIDDLRA